MARRILPPLLCAFFCVNLFAVNEIEPKVFGPTSGNVSYVATAYAGGKYLTVWRQLFWPTLGIWGAFSDADGKPPGPAFQLLDTANALGLHLFADGDSFLLVWDEANKSSQMCHIDGSGRATAPQLLDPDWGLRPDAFVDGCLIAHTADGIALFDRTGAKLRSGISPANGWSAQTAFAGVHSFFISGRWPDLTLSRYSLDGDLIRTFTLAKDQCQTTISPCSWIAGVQELGDGRLLLLLTTEAQTVATMVVAADGRASERVTIPTSFPQIRNAFLRRSGSQILALIEGGDKTGASYELEAHPVDSTGVPVGSAVPLLHDIEGSASFAIVVFAEAPDALMTVSVTGKYPSQVRSCLFRGLHAGDPQTLSITPTNQPAAQVASNGRNFLAAWIDTDGTRLDEAHWAVLDASGRRQSPVLGLGGTLVQHSLVSNGFDYLMLVSGGDPLVARRIAPDGTFLGETRLFERRDDWGRGIAVVPTSAGFLVVWSSGTVVYSRLLTPFGAAAAPQEILRIQGLPQGWSGSYDNPALAWSGNEALLVISRTEARFAMFPGYPDESTTELDAFRLRADGTLISSDPIRLSTAIAPTSHAVAASSGQEFVVAAANQRFVIGPGGVTATYTTLPYTAATDLIWDGNAYVLARGCDILEHLARDGRSLDASSREGLFSLDLAADALGNLVIVSSQLEATAPLRAFSYSPADFTPLPTRRRSVAFR